MRYVNLGCGHRYHPDWINIDITSSGPPVIQHDLSRDIPLPDDSCDVVYHSHVLEHMRRPNAITFMSECYRVLKPQGILRVAVPDLEQICLLYLNKLNSLMNQESTEERSDYQWIMLEMYDQTVREQSGGEMAAYLSQVPLPNETFVFERIGEEGRDLVRTLQSLSSQVRPPEESTQTRWSNPFKTASYQLKAMPNRLRRKLMTRWLGADYARALEIGRFRLGGEVHQWMYDRYSLASLMLETGFREPVQQSATSSSIPQWPKFNLDTLPDGTVNKPDSLFMEAFKK